MIIPRLSVCIITYNHEQYIHEAIDSVLKQEINFDLEIIIADDCSTDTTRSILQSYQSKYPKIIKLILQTSNKGPAQNWLDLMASPKGKYVAYFEGDDYWTDPHKLQKQVDFLETHPEFIASFHDVEMLNRSSRIVHHLPYPTGNVLNFSDVLKNHYIYTNTLVFRNQFEKLPEWFLSIKSGDIALELLLADKGFLFYMPEKMSVYRVHETSLSNTKSHQDNYLYFKGRKLLYVTLNKHFHNKYHLLFKMRSIQFFFEMFPKKGGRKKVFLHYLLRLILQPGRV